MKCALGLFASTIFVASCSVFLKRFSSPLPPTFNSGASRKSSSDASTTFQILPTNFSVARFTYVVQLNAIHVSGRSYLEYLVLAISTSVIPCPPPGHRSKCSQHHMFSITECILQQPTVFRLQNDPPLTMGR